MTKISFDAYNPGNQFRVGDAPGMRTHPITKEVEGHKGLDLPAATGTDIRVAADGKIVSIDFQYDKEKKTGWGNYVVVEHTREDGTKFYTLYAHLDHPSTLTKGATVAAGQAIGPVGATGGAKGPHLHVEVIPSVSGINGTPSRVDARLPPNTFTDWGGLPHMVGTDAAGNPLIARSSGSISDGTYVRTVEKLDATTRTVIGSYVDHTEALDDGAGNLTGYKVYTQNSVGDPLIISTLTNEGDLVRQTNIGDNGNTIGYTQSGIRIEIGADGQKLAYVPGYDGSVQVGADGGIPLNTSGGTIVLRLADDPLNGINTCTVGGEVYDYRGTQTVSSCLDGVMIYGEGAQSATDTYINGKGERIDFEYKRIEQIFEFGSFDSEWTLTGVTPVRVADADGNVAGNPGSLFNLEMAGFGLGGNTDTDEYQLARAHEDGGETVLSRTMLDTGYAVHETVTDAEGHIVEQATGWQRSVDSTVVPIDVGTNPDALAAALAIDQVMAMGNHVPVGETRTSTGGQLTEYPDGRSVLVESSGKFTYSDSVAGIATVYYPGADGAIGTVAMVDSRANQAEIYVIASGATHVVSAEIGLSGTSQQFVNNTKIVTTLNSDGSLNVTATRPDSTYSISTNDGLGNLRTVYYSPAGVITGQSWQNPDGSRGRVSVSPSGNVNSVSVNPDGSITRYADDGKGNTVVVDFDKNGKQVGTYWWKSDGSRGSETVAADGTRSGVAHAPDGSYQRYTIDRLGNQSGTTFDADGNFIQTQWKNIDGSYGLTRIDPEKRLIIDVVNNQGGESKTKTLRESIATTRIDLLHPLAMSVLDTAPKDLI